MNMIISLLTSSMFKSFAKKLFLGLAKEYVESTENRFDDILYKQVVDALS